ncbi:DNA translocase FtsK 4TM domain-containing protein [Dyella halodurans]|uniref:DNA translocase FtsK n=1 Tax=Dyella halodurans TaxID=1920171 RepID=A0ABV9BY17_9GAMM|nr:DNA translocase FtsK 4TM domain-containing protein [Dyella halodurans]
MLTFFFGAFGLSTLWLIPLIWRVARARLARRKAPAGGQGTIRLWLGALLVLTASATLEGLIVDHYTDDAQAGGVICRALAHGFGGLLGTPLASLVMLAILAAALPWYLGTPWLSAFKRINVVVDLLAALLARAVELAAARFGKQHGRGAVRRADRAATSMRRTTPVAARRTTAVAAAPPQPERTTPVAPVSPALSSTVSRQRAMPVRGKIISEPWLLPKSTRLSAATPTMPMARPTSAAATTNRPVTTAVAPMRAAAIEAVAVIDEQAVVSMRAEVLVDDEPITPLPHQHDEPETSEAVAESTEQRVAADVEPELVPLAQLVNPLPVASGRFRAANDDQVAAPEVRVAAPVMAAPSSRSSVLLPPLTLLAAATAEATSVDETQLADTSELIEQRLREFKVPVTVVGASAGPVITRFEVEPAVGVRGNQIVALMKDLARGLGRTSIRVVETIPGKTCMGLELPNEQRQMIALSEILDSAAYRDADSLLTLAMGKGITGEPVVADLARAPHMLVAGTTGSGKSVAVNAMILSMLYKATPDDVRMIMIDPKMLELSVYEGIPHLLAPVVTDMKLAANALAWCVAEMESRYRVMSDLRVRNLAGFNQKVREARAAGRPLMNPFPAHPEVPELLETLPMIVVVIDELADLMMVAGKKIEELIARLAQKARAAGIHLILATQRPSVDVITGLIKANIPTRVAFQVSSKIDSRTILDQMGAESLLGQGDMLFLPPGTGYPQRIHGAFVADEEVHRVVAHLKQYGEPDYKDEILAGPPSEAQGDLLGEEAGDAELDPLYDEAAAFVLRSRRASISFVQRQFRIGYNRAARLVEAMEAAGLVSSMGINGQRDVIAPGPSD